MIPESCWAQRNGLGPSTAECLGIDEPVDLPNILSNGHYVQGRAVFSSNFNRFAEEGRIKWEIDITKWWSLDIQETVTATWETVIWF